MFWQGRIDRRAKIDAVVSLMGVRVFPPTFRMRREPPEMPTLQRIILDDTTSIIAKSPTWEHPDEPMDGWRRGVSWVSLGNNAGAMCVNQVL
jgi:hypothetical protein